MTFIPDPTVFHCGEVVYLKKDISIRGYGCFTKHHEFVVKALSLRENDQSILLRDDQGRDLNVVQRDVTRVRPSNPTK